jgi:excisionase family DNA binding protein
VTAARAVRAPVIAEMLDLSLDRVYQLARENVIPNIRIGRQIRFDLDRVKAWMDAGGSAEAE